MKICVSIASYRDPDLVNTISSALHNAKYKNDIEFCVVSQDFHDSHPDLSFAPNINYHKYHWSESRGVCWARNIAIDNCDSDYILQIDSHSRFPDHWDEKILKCYEKVTSFWGERIYVTQYPYPFLFKEGREVFSQISEKLKTEPTWDKDNNIINIGKKWYPVKNTEYGDEVFHIAGGCTFASSRNFKDVLPDPEIYFNGEEMSIAMRAYSRGIRMVTPSLNFIYSNFDRNNYNRGFHWSDHIARSHKYDERSKLKLREIYSGRLKGFWGIDSEQLHKQFLKLIDMEFLEKI